MKQTGFPRYLELIAARYLQQSRLAWVGRRALHQSLKTLNRREYEFFMSELLFDAFASFRHIWKRSGLASAS
jgi:hypothetical protein